MKATQTDLSMEVAGRYRIHVKGVLNERWSDFVQGMNIRNLRQPADDSVTILTGELVDQAALLGVLMALYNMAYPLLSVELIDPTEEL